MAKSRAERPPDADDYFPYLAWRDAEARLDEGERRQREYHRVWSPAVCKSTGVPLVVMESQRRQLADLRAAAAARAAILAEKEANGAVESDSRPAASGAGRVQA